MEKNQLKFIFSIITSSILFVFIAVLLSRYGEFSARALPLMAAFYICLIALVFAIFGNSANPIFLMFLLYMILFYILPGLFHVYTDFFPFYQPFYDRAIIANAGILVFMFCVFVIFGYIISGKYIINYTTSAVAAPELRGDVGSIAIVFCGLFSVVSGLAVGIDYINQSRSGGDIYVELNPINLTIISLCRVTGFLCFLYTLVFRRALDKFYFILMLIFSVIVFYYSNNPVATPRFVIASYFLAIYYIFVNPTRLRKLLFVLFFAVMQISIFPLMSEIGRGDINNIFDMKIIEYYITSGDFDGFQSTVSTVAMVESGGINFGLNLISAILFFVPRAFWQNKSYGTGVDAGIYMGFDFTNLSAPLPAEFFVDFYWFGVVILSFFVGLFFGWFDAVYKVYSDKKDKRKLIVYSISIGYIFILLRGSLVAVLGPVALSILLAFLFEIFFKKYDLHK